MENKKRQSRGEMTKREALRAERERKSRQQRLLVVGGIGAVVLLVALLIALPAIQAARAPVGEIVDITPVARQQADGLAIGNPNAPIKIDVFEDFQCPACATYTQQIEPQVINNLVLTGQAYYVFHHYPFLDDRMVVKESDDSANASMCANDQGRFWDYHDMLYANSKEFEGAFTKKRLEAYADRLGLDMGAFRSCLNANTFDNEVQADRALGDQMGVTGTPSVFVNGKQVNPGYVPSFEDIQKAVQEAAAQ